MNGIFSRTAASAVVAILLAGGAAHVQQSVPAPMGAAADTAKENFLLRRGVSRLLVSR
jgi:hypothetical protein